MVFNANTESKTEYTIWKNIKNWAENWCQIVCGILFDLIYSMTNSGNLITTEIISKMLLWCQKAKGP